MEKNFEVVRHIAVLSDGKWQTELNIVKWYDNEPCYDLRTWSPGREKCGKGITLNEQMAFNLMNALKGEFEKEVK